jgi:hypothetical protein
MALGPPPSLPTAAAATADARGCTEWLTPLQGCVTYCAQNDLRCRFARSSQCYELEQLAWFLQQVLPRSVTAGVHVMTTAVGGPAVFQVPEPLHQRAEQHRLTVSCARND